jgi:GNAT superfamily N-acetyltransferase
MAVRWGPALGRYEDFFEVVGVKKPGGAGCWCMAYRDSRVPSEERPAYMREECSREPGPGVLVYVDDVPAGWCSVAPRRSYRRLMHSRTIPFVDDRQAWSVVCFVVRAGYRRRGLMHALLAAAVEYARQCGADVIEGYPVDLGAGQRVDVISGYVGTRRLFEAAGFEVAGPTTGHSGGRPRVIMRREPGPP